MRLGKAIDCRDDAVLHFLKRLSLGETKSAREPLNRFPIPELAQVLELGTCPLPEVALGEARLDLDRNAEKVRKWLGGLLGTLEWGTVKSRRRSFEAGYPFGSGKGLLAPVVREGQAPGTSRQHLSGRRGRAVAHHERDGRGR